MSKVFQILKYLIVFVVGAITGILTFVKVVGKFLVRVDGIDDFKKSFIDILAKAMVGKSCYNWRRYDTFAGYSSYYQKPKRSWESEDDEDAKGDTI